MTQLGLPAFVRQVHYVEDRATALERAVEVVQAATGAGWVAAYTPDAVGALTRGPIAGEEPLSLPDVVDEDDPALVALRADRAVLDGPADSVLAGTLILPFVTAGGITGLIAVGRVPYAYTAAERDTLLAAASAVGLALEALQLRALRMELERWRQRAELAERELTLLHQVFDRLPSADPASYSAG